MTPGNSKVCGRFIAAAAGLAIAAASGSAMAGSCEKTSGWKPTDYVEFRFENSQSVDQDVKVAVSDADGNVTKRIQDKVDAGQSEIVGARIKVLPGTWSYRVSFGVAGTSGANDKEVTFTFEVREDGKDKRDARYIGQSSGESHECDRDYKKSNNTWKIKLGA